MTSVTEESQAERLETYLRRLNEPFVSEGVYGAYIRLRDRWFTPMGRGFLLAGLLLGIFSLDLEKKQTFVLWSCLFGVGLTSAVSSVFTRLRVRMERRMPSHVTAGAEITYSATVTNEGTTPVHDLVVREEFTPGMRPVLTDGAGGAIGLVLPGETRRVALRTRFPRRGRYRMRALRGETTCPFGLVRSGMTTPVESPITVFPRTHPIANLEFTHARVYQPGGVPLSASIGESSEFVGLRDYRPGDPLRHLCWKAWARSGKPVVREFQGEYFRRVAVVLDTRVDDPRTHRDAFEAAVEVAASLVDYFDRHEFIIDLFAAGPDVYYLQSGMGLSHMEQVLDLLSCVEPSTAESLPRIDDPLRSLFGRLSGLVIVATDWWNESHDFHQQLVSEVPEIKVMLTTRGLTIRSPEPDIEERLLRRIRPDHVTEDVIVL